MGSARRRVLVRGAGDIGSAVAVHLFHAGHAVAIHEGQRPTTSRRGMAFADAVFDAEAARTAPNERNRRQTRTRRLDGLGGTPTRSNRSCCGAPTPAHARLR